MDQTKSGPPSLRLCGFVAISGHSLDDITTVGKTIWEVANNPMFFPDVRQLVPNSWRRVWAVMDALRDGADPESAVRLEGSAGPMEGRAKHDFVTEEDAFEAWRSAECESAAQLGASEGGDEQVGLCGFLQAIPGDLIGRAVQNLI